MDKDLKEQIKKLKERIKIKNEKIKALNIKLENSDKKLIYLQERKRYWRHKYNSMSESLPLKYYKIRYSITCIITGKLISNNEGIRTAYNPKELFVNLEPENDTHEFNLIDILEVAS